MEAAGWAVLALAVVGAVAWGAVQGAKRQSQGRIRRDLWGLHDAKRGVEAMALLNSRGKAFAFVPPAGPSRDWPVGWLWVRASKTGQDQAHVVTGWALTYRGARRDAGLPLRLRHRTDTEITVTEHETRYE